MFFFIIGQKMMKCWRNYYLFPFSHESLRLTSKASASGTSFQNQITSTIKEIWFLLYSHKYKKLTSRLKKNIISFVCLLNAPLQYTQVNNKAHEPLFHGKGWGVEFLGALCSRALKKFLDPLISTCVPMHLSQKSIMSWKTRVSQWW